MYARCHSSTSILHGSKLMFAQSILCSILPTQLACQRDTASDIGSLEVPHLWVVLPAISMKFLHINEIPASKCAWRESIFSFESHDLDNQKVNVPPIWAFLVHWLDHAAQWEVRSCWISMLSMTDMVLPCKGYQGFILGWSAGLSKYSSHPNGIEKVQADPGSQKSSACFKESSRKSSLPNHQKNVNEFRLKEMNLFIPHVTTCKLVWTSKWMIFLKNRLPLNTS